MRAERKAFLLMAAFGLCPFMREILALSVCALAKSAQFSSSATKLPLREIADA
jgi:hypothetical protein